MANSKSHKHGLRNTFIILFILISLVLVALFFTPIGNMIFSKNTAEASVMVDLPRIKTSIPSSSSGNSHNLEVDISISLDSNAAKDIDVESVKTQVQKFITSIDYDTLTEVGDTDYILDTILPEISTLFSEDVLKGVYITDVVTDFVLSTKDTGGAKGNPIDNTLDAMSNMDKKK